MCEKHEETLQSLSMKSFSPSQIQEVMAQAIETLTGQKNVSCEINNLEYSSTRDGWCVDMEKYTDTLIATIKIKGDRENIDLTFKDFIEKER